MKAPAVPQREGRTHWMAWFGFLSVVLVVILATIIGSVWAFKHSRIRARPVPSSEFSAHARST